MDLRTQLQATLGDAYTLERELGGGGVSRVFVAEETALRRKVVVKVLLPELAAGISAERFRREVLPAGWMLTNSSIPATVSEQPDGRLRLDFINPRADEIAVLITARRRGTR